LKGTLPSVAETTSSESSALSESAVQFSLQEENAPLKRPADVPDELKQGQNAVERVPEIASREYAPSNFWARVVSQAQEVLPPARIKNEDDGRDSLKEAMRRVLLPKKLERLEAEIQELERKLAKLERTSEKNAESSSKIERRRQRSESLPAKSQDCSQYFDAAKLTTRQREVISLRLEYELPVSEIARRLGISRKTVDEHFDAAKRKINQLGSKVRRDKKRAE
jgi:DNA-binding CsgD family transcriptional regulator